MLLAHLVPGYLAAASTRARWNPAWSARRRFLLWAAALGSTAAPDTDVIYNALFRGFMNHSTLWTHSLFVHLGIAASWLVLRLAKRWPFAQTLVGLVAIGGLSHLFLDTISHNTLLFYPLSRIVVGIAPLRVMQGGFWAYITDPIFLLEPCLFALAAVYWILHRPWSQRAKTMAVAALAGGLALFSGVFLALLPVLSRIV